MTFDDASLELFNQLHNAIANIQYHQTLSGKWELWSVGARILSGVLIILGVAVGFWPWRRDEHVNIKDRESINAHEEAKKRVLRWQVGSAVIIAVASIGLFLSPFSDWHLKHSRLLRDWTVVRRQVEQLETQLYRLPDRNTVPDFIVDGIESVKMARADLVRDEGEKVDIALRDRSWEDANEILFGKDVRTKEQVEQDYIKRREQGLKPVRPFTPLEAARQVIEAKG